MNTTTNMEIANDSKMVRIASNEYAGSTTYITVCYVNNGETAVRSKTFKSLKGAEKAARNWLGL